MKTIYIGADHRGFELKKTLIAWLKKKGCPVEDCGNTTYDPDDDYPDFVKKVVDKILSCDSELTTQDSLGIIICGSGVGVSIAANRYRGIYCALGFDASQVKSAREHDHINVLALGSDYVNNKKAQKITEAFLTTPLITHTKYLRRLKKVDTV